MSTGKRKKPAAAAAANPAAAATTSVFRTYAVPSATKRSKPDPKGFKASDKEPMCYFSNFFGGAEFTYMSLRTTNPSLKLLYTRLRDMDWNSDAGYERFKQYRVRLMGKNMYKVGYRDPYKKSDRVAAGLLAKLISGCWRTSMHKRLIEVNKMASEEVIKARELGIDVEATPISSTDFIDGSDGEKEEWMMKALRLKYSKEFFKGLLLKADDGIYERKGRDTAKLWCGPEGLLARCLRNIKKELRVE